MALMKVGSEGSRTLPRVLPQIVSGDDCFRCDVCCRFPEAESVLRPYFTGEEIAAAVSQGLSATSFPDASGSQINLSKNPSGEGFLCPAFESATGRCSIYDVRPLDCQVYPLAVMWAADGQEVLLGWDSKCPIMREAIPVEIAAHAKRVASLLGTDAIIETVIAHPRLIGPFQDDVVVLQPLPRLTARLLQITNTPQLRPLTLSDAHPVVRSLRIAGVLRADAPAAYAFPYHYIWTKLLPYRWLEIHETWFLFAQSPDGWFMPLLPLGPKPVTETVVQAFALMRRLNGRSPVNRIENVVASVIPSLDEVGLRCLRREGDYLYKAEALAALSGDSYKSQRALCNRVERGEAMQAEPYSKRHQTGCLALFERWALQKQKGSLDGMGAMLLQDAKSAHDLVFAEHDGIGLSGTVVISRGRVVAYTFGYWLTPQTWCVLLEVADRSITGLSQWLFRQTCRDALDKGAVYINAMDDAGIPGLREAKTAYHPESLIESWLVTEC